MPVGKADIDEVVDQYESDAKERSGADFFKFENGDSRIRIIPPAPGQKRFFLRRMTHWGVVESGVEKQGGENFNCPRALDKTAKCFLCDQAAELLASEDADDKAVGKELLARSQWLYNIVDLDDVDAGIQVCGMNKTCHTKIGTYVADPDYGDISDLAEGYNLIVTKTTKKKKIDYDVRAKKNPTAAPEAIVEYLEANDPPDLSKFAEPASRKAMKAAWEGEEFDEDEDEKPKAKGKSRRAVREEDDDEDEKPKAKKSKSAEPEEAPKAKTKKAAEPNDDDDEDEDEKPDELPFPAEDEKPKAKGKTKGKPEPEPDEDEDDDEAEDDDKPRVSAGQRLRNRRQARR